MSNEDDWIDHRVLAAQTGLQLTVSAVDRVRALLRGDLRVRQFTHAELTKTAGALQADMVLPPATPDSMP